MVVLLVEDGGAVVGPDSKSAPRGEISSYARGLAVYSRRISRPDLKYGAEEADSTKRHGGCDCGTRDDRRTPWMRAPSKAAWLDRVRCKSRLPRGGSAVTSDPRCLAFRGLDWNFKLHADDLGHDLRSIGYCPMDDEEDH